MEYTTVVNKDNTISILKDGQIAYTITQTESGPICNCPGFTYRNTCKHIEMVKDLLNAPTKNSRFSRELVSNIVDQIKPIFDKYGLTFDVVGSYRRGLPYCKDIDIIVPLYNDIDTWNKLIDDLELHKEYTKIVRGSLITRGTWNGYPLDINRIDLPTDYIPQLLYRTGSKVNNIKMRGIAKSKGFILNEHGIFNAETKELLSGNFTHEHEFYEFLGLKYLSPEER